MKLAELNTCGLSYGSNKNLELFIRIVYKQIKFEQLVNIILTEGTEAVIAGKEHCNYYKSSENKVLNDFIRINGFYQIIKG